MQTGAALAGDACFENVQALDRELAGLAHKSGSLRFALGLGLEALARGSGHEDLGFASIETYGVERCERHATWIGQSRSLVRRVSELPRLREALISGQVSWSMALVIVRFATSENEAELVQASAGCTVSRMKELLSAPDAEDDESSDGSAQEQEQCTLTLTENHEDVLLFECARILAGHLGANTMNEVVDAIIGEASSSLLELLPRDAEDPHDLAPRLDAQNAYIRQRTEWRKEAERMCEPHLPSWSEGSDTSPALHEMPDFSGDAESIDAAIRQISDQLQTRDVALGELAERFWKADGWRRLRYATAEQYARERLGMSLSSIKEKRKLARKLRQLPHLNRVFHEHQVGYEAARVVAGIATHETDAAWAERAVERTIVNLKEEVKAAGIVSRVEQREHVEPPDDALVEGLRALEARVVTGAVFIDASAGAGQTTPRSTQGGDSATETVAAIEAAFNAARHAPRHLLSRGRDTLRLRVEPEIRAAYRGLERLFERHRPLQMSFLRFACQALIDMHAHELPDVAYGHIYARDGLRCMNPFCTRRDCTPHHVTFRAHGGDDSDDNLVTLCTWCHLEGVHRGRFTVTRENGVLVWRFGSHTVVKGRRRIRTRDAGSRAKPGDGAVTAV